jgi:hypothetical protein
MAKKKTAATKSSNRLRDLYGALEDQVRTQLDVRRLAHKNAEARGDAAEEVWLDLLTSHLPNRYRAGKGIVIDSNGLESDYLDIIIYDRHFTPPVFSDLYIPAESVYAVIETKQELSRANIIYAGEKAESVRRLFRTNAAVVHAGGTVTAPRDPFRIAAGIVTYKSSWTREPFGIPFENAFVELLPSQRLDFGIAADHGYFEVEYEDDGPTVNRFLKTRALAAFLIRLLARLQKLGTVPAIDYAMYSKILSV